MIYCYMFFQYMANIPQPPEEEKESTTEAEQSDDKGGKHEEKGTEVASEANEQPGSPIVNEVEQMEADEN